MLGQRQNLVSGGGVGKVLLNLVDVKTDDHEAYTVALIKRFDN